MSRANNTPVFYWQELRLSELENWIAAHNQIEEDGRRQAEERAKQAARKKYK